MLVAILWPPLLGFAYLNLSPQHLPIFVDYAALGIILLPGAIAVWWLCPFQWLGKSVLTILYVLVMGWLLFVLALGTGCARIGNCV